MPSIFDLMHNSIKAYIVHPSMSLCNPSENLTNNPGTWNDYYQLASGQLLVNSTSCTNQTRVAMDFIVFMVG